MFDRADNLRQKNTFAILFFTHKFYNYLFINKLYQKKLSIIMNK